VNTRPDTSAITSSDSRRWLRNRASGFIPPV
jgi:hypothetical protein